MKDVLISMLSIFVQKTTVYLWPERGEVEVVGMEWVRQGWKIGKNEQGVRRLRLNSWFLLFIG